MNPILVKELRQSVRNRFALGAYLIYLLLLLIATGFALASVMAAAHERPDEVFSAGTAAFGVSFGLLCVVTMLFIPIYTSVRIIRERWRADMDLAFITPMAPRLFVQGKLLSALALAALFVSGTLPFMFLSCFLGGVSVANVAVCFALYLIGITGAVLAGIVLGIAPMPMIIRVLALLQFVQTVFSLSLMVLSMPFESGTFDLSALLMTWKSAVLFLDFVGMLATGCVLLYAGALAGFRDSRQNRMGPFRITATVCWVFWGFLLTVQSLSPVFRGSHLIEIWIGVSVVALMGLLFFAASERRLTALAWCAMMMAANAAIGFAAMAFLMEDKLIGLLVAGLTVLGCVLALTLLWRFCLRRLIPQHALWWIEWLLVSLLNIALGILYMATGNAAAPYLPGFVGADAKVLPVVCAWDAVLAILLLVAIAVDRRRRIM